eukprot:246202_1
MSSKPDRRSLLRNLVSRAANKKVGRQLLSKQIGEDGKDIMEALKFAISRHLDSDTGKLIERELARFVLKAAVMFKEGHLTAKVLQPLSSTLRHLKIPLLHALETSHDSVMKTDVEKLKEKLSNVTNSLISILGPFMTPANAELFKVLCDQLTDEEFLWFLLSDKSCKGEKQTLFRSCSKIAMYEDFSTERFEKLMNPQLWAEKYSLPMNDMANIAKSLRKDPGKILSKIKKVWESQFDSEPMPFAGGDTSLPEFASLFGLFLTRIPNAESSVASLQEFGKRQFPSGFNKRSMKKLRWASCRALEQLHLLDNIHKRMCWVTFFNLFTWIMFIYKPVAV